MLAQPVALPTLSSFLVHMAPTTVHLATFSLCFFFAKDAVGAKETATAVTTAARSNFLIMVVLPCDPLGDPLKESPGRMPGVLVILGILHWMVIESEAHCYSQIVAGKRFNQIHIASRAQRN
jgi:hypothetical protein